LQQNKALMKKLLLPFCILVLLCGNAIAQTNTVPATPAKPKLVIGIVVDQMRWDFLYRYTDKYGSNGFKRLLREGYSCENTHINYSPSYTAPGHSCIYTGSVPSIHGITGNGWYDLTEGQEVSNVGDSTQTTVGSTSDVGKTSPHRLLVTTITDELKLANNMQSKVIGIALKDRASILPAGHAANAAYFFDGSVGVWVTSSYYMKKLPDWVNQFNSKDLPQAYVAKNWNTLLPIIQYNESQPDDEPYERPFKNETKPVFEHNVSGMMKEGLGVIDATPFGNSLTLDFAKAAIENEKMGKGKYTDFLALSLSSTDYIGHQFGPNSVEIEDCYLRLDKDLESFFNYLDQTIGKGNYVLFLSADHGAAHVPDFLKENKIPAGVFNIDTTLKQLNAHLVQKYGDGNWVLSYDNMQVYLNHTLMDAKKLDPSEVKAVTVKFLNGFTGINQAIDLAEIDDALIDATMKQNIANGVYPNRSGDVFILYQPGWFESYTKGTTHGTQYAYDTHIPLVFMGWKIPHAEDHTDVHMTDIAPTLAALLHIQEPNGNIGKVITGIFKK
jgi:predicted AlkP superfamily pyrophosphatase or phosphodiesterase